MARKYRYRLQIKATSELLVYLTGNLHMAPKLIPQAVVCAPRGEYTAIDLVVSSDLCDELDTQLLSWFSDPSLSDIYGQCVTGSLMFWTKNPMLEV